MSNQRGKKPFQQKGKGKNPSQSNDKQKKSCMICGKKGHELQDCWYNSFAQGSSSNKNPKQKGQNLQNQGEWKQSRPQRRQKQGNVVNDGNELIEDFGDLAFVH